MVLTTDATPRVHLAPEQVLKDEQRVGRLIAALSQGIFHDVDEKKASEILQECLKICGGSTNTLSKVLQSNFLGNHTPYYWAITNKDPQCHSPQLLKDIMFHGGTLTLETQKDIVKAFGMEFDSVLYEAIKHKLTMVQTFEVCPTPSFLGQEDMPTFMVSTRYAGPQATVRFDIPQIFGRLLANHSLCFQFYALGGLFSLTAALSESAGSTQADRPSWRFLLDEVPSQGTTASRLNKVHGRFDLQWVDGSRKCSSSRDYDNSYPRQAFPTVYMDRDLSHFFRNTYTDNPRGQLSGTLTMHVKQ